MACIFKSNPKIIYSPKNQFEVNFKCSYLLNGISEYFCIKQCDYFFSLFLGHPVYIYIFQTLFKVNK